jgi:hypothetical protein
MALSAALALNLWILGALLPLGLGRAFSQLGLGLSLLAMALPPAVLAAGILFRSAPALLVVFPAVALVPEALLSTSALPVAPLPLLGGSLIAYLFASAHALGTGDAPLAPLAAQTLPLAPVPVRWRRRLRVYRGLAAQAAILPLGLLAWIGHPFLARGALEASFGEQADRAAAVLTVGVALLWAGLFRAYLVGPLEGHLHHDRQVRKEIETAKQQRKLGRPRAGFYLAVAVALAALAAIAWRRV